MRSNPLRLLFALTVVLIFGLPALNAQTEPANQKSYSFINGQWFNGKKFERRAFYSVNGVLTQRKPKRVDEIVDLENGFVIPPFADAHTHNLDGNFNLDKLVNAYLGEGTFYVQVLGNSSTGLDNFGQTLLPEILYFHDNKIFDNRTLLKIAVETTPQAIFPNRRIGRLREGCEASFLVLRGDPLADFNQIKKIERRFKQGVFISLDGKP